MTDALLLSVCIPASGRHDTIQNTIKSLKNQKFKGFEVIVTVRRDQLTLDIITAYLQTLEGNDFPNGIKCVNIDRDIEGISDWNDPLNLAVGKYVIMLEGDDQFHPEHLDKVKDRISNSQDLGVIAFSNHDTKRLRSGCFSPELALQNLLKLDDVPPPSETAFIRLDTNNQPFMYDEFYEYAPEIDLYLRIALDGKNFYYSQDQTVLRDRTRTRSKGIGWKYFRDHLEILEKYQNKISFFKRSYVRYRLELKLIINILKENALHNQSFKKSLLTRKIFKKLQTPVLENKVCRLCEANQTAHFLNVSDNNFQSTNLKFDWAKCESCQSLNLISTAKNEILSTYYEMYAPHALKPSPLLAATDPYQRQIHLIKDFLESRKNASNVNLIDLGCGSGAALSILSEKFPGLILHGLDYNIQPATENLASLNVSLTQGSFSEIPDSKRFDIIISSQLFEHLEKPDEFKDFIRKHAASRALIITDIPNIESKSFKIFGSNWVNLDTPRHRQLATRGGFIRLVNCPVTYQSYVFGSYMAYVSSICLWLFGTPAPTSPLKRLFRRCLQVLLYFLPKRFCDDKLMISFKLPH